MARFVGKLAATLVCTTFVTVQFPTPLGQAQVQSQGIRIGAYAKKITVRIDGQQEGSGFIIEKSGNIYTVLTNWHVVDEAGTYSVTTVDGQKYDVNYSSVQKLPGLDLAPQLDLARLQFESSSNYEQASFGDSNELLTGQQVFFAGYPKEIKTEPGRNYTFQTVSIRRILSTPNEEGYAIVYNGEALPGMSGGPVLDSNNNVIGIHGDSNIHGLTSAASLYAIPSNLAGLQLELTATLTGHEGTVWSVAFSPDGKILASGGEDKTIKLWNVDTGKLISTLSGYEGDVHSVIFSPDGKILASGGEDKTIKLWDVNTGELLSTLSGYEGTVWSVAFSPDSKILASGGYSTSDDTIKLWDVNTGELLSVLSRHEGTVYSVTFSPDGKTLASGSWDNTVKLWNVQTGELLSTLTGHQNIVYSVTFSPDGKTLASGSWDNTVKLWNMETNRLSSNLAGHEDTVVSVTFSPDGKTLASGGWDNRIKLWNVNTGKLHYTLAGSEISIWSISFSPDGRILASGGSDSTVKLWRVP